MRRRGISLTTSLRTAIMSVLVSGLHGTTGRCGVGRMTMTKKISTGGKLHGTFQRRTRGCN